ncbi:unnamed protein product, partial [Owenia fusiformis]
MEEPAKKPPNIRTVLGIVDRIMQSMGDVEVYTYEFTRWCIEQVYVRVFGYHVNLEMLAPFGTDEGPKRQVDPPRVGLSTILDADTINSSVILKNYADYEEGKPIQASLRVPLSKLNRQNRPKPPPVPPKPRKSQDRYVQQTVHLPVIEEVPLESNEIQPKSLMLSQTVQDIHCHSIHEAPHVFQQRSHNVQERPFELALNVHLPSSSIQQRVESKNTMLVNESMRIQPASSITDGESEYQSNGTQPSITDMNDLSYDSIDDVRPRVLSTIEESTDSEDEEDQNSNVEVELNAFESCVIENGLVTYEHLHDQSSMDNSLALDINLTEQSEEALISVPGLKQDIAEDFKSLDSGISSMDMLDANNVDPLYVLEQYSG